jgi:HAD superfamily hydrolase (TIGR01509 family)
VPPGLIIFDCDGVLIDSETIACRADSACLAELGIVLSADEILDRYLGISAAAMCADIERRLGRVLPADFAATLQRRVAAAFERELAPMPGVAAVLAALHERRCVASSSAPERLRHSLALTGLLHCFEPHLYSAAQVARGKPAPDLFLFAAAAMQVAPGACVVVEDSVAGVQAAVAAGMRAIGFTGGIAGPAMPRGCAPRAPPRSPPTWRNSWRWSGEREALPRRCSCQYDE